MPDDCLFKKKHRGGVGSLVAMHGAGPCGFGGGHGAVLEKVSMGECSLGWMMSLAQVAMDAPQPQ